LSLLQGKTDKDVEKGMHGVGQLLIAMLTQYVKWGGENSTLGFMLTPKMVCRLNYSQSLHLLY